MHPSNDNKAAGFIDSKVDAVEQPPFSDGHEHESTTEHLSEIAFDTKDGFGNALWDTRAKKNEGAEQMVEEKIPPAF